MKRLLLVITLAGCTAATNPIAQQVAPAAHHGSQLCWNVLELATPTMLENHPVVYNAPEGRWTWFSATNALTTHIATVQPGSDPPYVVKIGDNVNTTVPNVPTITVAEESPGPDSGSGVEMSMTYCY